MKFHMNCPVRLDDDICDAWIKIHAWPAEKMTHEYPGSPAGFEVSEAPCGHAVFIEDLYEDEVLRYAEKVVRDLLEAASERRAARLEDR